MLVTVDDTVAAIGLVELEPVCVELEAVELFDELELERYATADVEVNVVEGAFVLLLALDSVEVK